MSKILIVEDEPDMVLGLKDNFEFEGYEVTTATDGQSGLDRARQLKPDLIVLDVMLPKISGLEVCKTLRGEGWERSQRIIAQKEAKRANEATEVAKSEAIRANSAKEEETKQRRIAEDREREARTERERARHQEHAEQPAAWRQRCEAPPDRDLSL